MTSTGLLTSRWTPLKYHPEQQRLWTTKARFVTVPAGRRSGKTELGKRRIVRAALQGTRAENPRFFAGAPTYGQAKRIYWDDLKKLIPKHFLACRPSESELVISLVNGAEIHVVGLDKPERVEGSPWDGCLITEFGNTKEGMWGANIRPALADRQGWAVLEGVPEGRNHYYDMDLKARADTTGEWAAFHWISADILPEEEIKAAKRDLDPQTYLQEYEANFLNFSGRCYYVFDSAKHCRPLDYDPHAPLIFTFDFNVSPGTAAVIQEMKLPGQFKIDPQFNVPSLNKPIYGTGVIGEVWIPSNSNTPAVCAKLIEDWGDHKGPIHCYGDATGGSSGTAKVSGSDWELIEQAMYRHYGSGRVHMMQKSSNPRERARINAVNTRLLNGAGEIHLMVDPEKAPNVVRDFDGVVLLQGGAGEIDKKKTPQLTHLTDGIGYYIEDQFPVDGSSVSNIQITGV